VKARARKRPHFQVGLQPRSGNTIFSAKPVEYMIPGNWQIRWRGRGGMENNYPVARAPDRCSPNFKIWIGAYLVPVKWRYYDPQHITIPLPRPPLISGRAWTPFHCTGSTRAQFIGNEIRARRLAAVASITIKDVRTRGHINVLLEYPSEFTRHSMRRWPPGVTGLGGRFVRGPRGRCDRPRPVRIYPRRMPSPRS